MCPFVYVLWVDASHPTTGEWHLKADVDHKPSMKAETGGFLVHRDKDIVQVAVSVAGRGTEDEQYTGIMTLPMACVMQIVEWPPSGGKPKVTYRQRTRK